MNPLKNLEENIKIHDPKPPKRDFTKDLPTTTVAEDNDDDFDTVEEKKREYGNKRGGFRGGRGSGRGGRGGHNKDGEERQPGSSSHNDEVRS